MTYIRVKHTITMLAASVVIVILSVARADNGESLTAPAADDEITAMIRDLGDPVYEKRLFATRRLCAIGMPATKRLRTAANGDDVEVALRAKAVLSVLDRLMFSSVEVRLSFSKTRIAWDEPIDLILTLVNRSKHPARIPFMIGPSGQTASVDDAQQVGNMLDVADLLRVRASEGREVDLTVDDIAADPGVVAAVGERLNGGPSSLLGPKQEAMVTAFAFNRGWARYRLLDAGVYTVVLDYTPEWDDDVLAAQRVGRVVSNPATITVTTGAPAAVSREGAEASLTVHRDGLFIVTQLTNRTDQTVLVNKNFGRSPPFAEGRWVYLRDGTRHEVPVIHKRAASWHDFDAALLVEAKPGQSIELARIHLAELRRTLVDAGARLGDDRWTVHFSYANLCDRQWQTRQGSALLGNPKAPTIFQHPLPRRILSTRHTSNRLTAPNTD